MTVGTSVITFAASALAVDPFVFFFLAIILGPLMVMALTLFILLEWASHSRVRYWRMHAIALVFLMSIVVFGWPLRLSFVLHRPAFNRVADQWVTGTPPQPPFRVGLFRVNGARVLLDGSVALWFDTDPGGPGGFVRTPTPGTRPRCNIWSDTRLDSRWHLIYED